jgi:LysM repeat protein
VPARFTPRAPRSTPWLILRIVLAIGVLPQATAATVRADSHLVQPGETLSEIAESYGVPLSELAGVNDIADPDVIVAGTALFIPDGEEAPAASNGTAAAPNGTYRVEAGDTLEGIAATFDTSVASLLAANPEVADPDLIVAGQVLDIPSGSAVAAGNGSVAALLRGTALDYGLDPTLVQAVAWQESGWRQGVVSPAGAVGIMQLLPETGAWIAQDLVGAPLDITDSASDNLIAGVALLSWLLDRTGNMDLALAYYVQGQGSVARNGIYPETWDYIASVDTIRSYIARYGAPPR